MLHREAFMDRRQPEQPVLRSRTHSTFPAPPLLLTEPGSSCVVHSIRGGYRSETKSSVPIPIGIRERIAPTNSVDRGYADWRPHCLSHQNTSYLHSTTAQAFGCPWLMVG